MSAELMLFLSIIVIIAIVAVCALVVYLERNFTSEKFDERQKIARGNAYRFSHWIGMVYYFGLLVYFVFHVGKNEWPLEPFLLVAIGILIQLESFHVYCLMTHSALPLGEKPMTTIVGYFAVGGMYLAQFFLQYIHEDKAAAAGLAGAGSFNLFRLLITIDFFTLAILHLIAYIRDRKE